MKTIDLTSLQVITESDIDGLFRQSATEVILAERAIVTPSAKEALVSRGIAVRNPGSSSGAASSGGAVASVPGLDPKRLALFTSSEAQKIKEEICAVGRKLWMRQYVDGNGGNISYRIGPNEVICTPTLVSKSDLTPADMCMVDLEGNQLAGGRPRTSEILLHLEIYKEVAEAKAVVHCHPPHATAYAITGKVPPTCVIPEYEVFIGKVAISPYQTPGSSTFAKTVLPYVKTHNTVLLANHGIVCWGDTVTHAEWYVEVVDTYCWTLMLASQLGAPLSHISNEQASDLLAIKKKLGLPDPRHDNPDCAICDLPGKSGEIAIDPRTCGAALPDRESLIEAITNQVMSALEKSK